MRGDAGSQSRFPRRQSIEQLVSSADCDSADPESCSGRLTTLDSRVIGRGPDVNGVLRHDGFACCPSETQQSRYLQYRDHFSKSAAEQVVVRVLLDKKGIVMCPVNRIPSGEPIMRRIPGFGVFQST